MGSIIALAAAIAGLALFAGAGNAHAAPVKFESTKVVRSTPAQVAAVNAKLAARAKAAQSTTTLTVAYGCDQVALWQSLGDSQISTMLNTSGGFGYLNSRFYVRRSATWLSCQLGLSSKNGAPINACETTVEVAGTDAHITGWQITYRNCHG